MKDAFDPLLLVRDNIRKLTPYSSARSEFNGNAHVFLDANENAIGSAAGAEINRYPDPLQAALKLRIATLKKVGLENIFIGNGSDEPIDLLIRAFCNPGKDHIIICPPTYGMYEVSADINDVEVKKVMLTPAFKINITRVLEEIDPETKLIFICSPNNPTGNLMNRADIVLLLKTFAGIVVVDEAYIDFCPSDTLLPLINEYPNLVILQTFSKAWGMAGLRVGMAFAAEEIIGVLNRIKPPYNISGLAQHVALNALDNDGLVKEWVEIIVEERQRLSTLMQGYDFIRKVYPSDSNFLLVKVEDAKTLYSFLLGYGIVVRDRSTQPLCTDTLRVTVGTKEENDFLIETLNKHKL